MVRILLSLVVACVLLSGSAEASCVTDGQGPCYRYWKVDAVFVAKVLEKVSLPIPGLEVPEGMIAVGGDARLRVLVVEAFRGVKAGATLTMSAPDDVCAGIDAEDGGELFIYASKNKKGDLWAQGCGVSHPLEDAEADLAYARSVTNGGPPALVYGDVHLREDTYGDSRDFSALTGVRVRVTGKNFVAETETDQEGNYAITLPGSGTYSIDVITEEGLVNWFPEDRQFEIDDPRSCYRAMIQMRTNGRIRGRVVDDRGDPVANLVVGVGDDDGFGKTDESGAFEIGPLSPGTFSLSVVSGSRNYELMLGNARSVDVREGQVSEVKPLTLIGGSRLVIMSIDVTGPTADEALMEIRSETGQPVGSLLRVNGTVQVLVRKNQSFEIVAATHTHDAKATVQVRAAPAHVTLTLRPSREPQ